MTDSAATIETLAAILTEHGALALEDIAQRLYEAGVADPDTAITEILDECSCPAAELPDGRWVWLPTLLAGRVFTHRLAAHEITHDLLTLTPDLRPIGELCYYDGYRGFADGSPATVVLPDFDEMLLEERGIPVKLVDKSGALLLKPGTLAGLTVAAGDLVGLRWTDDGFALEPVSATADTKVGVRLAALLDADRPSRFAKVVWAACTEDPDLFRIPLTPLGEIADEHGLVRRDNRLAPSGFDFDRCDFEGKYARLAVRYGLESDDAFALTTLIELHGQKAQQLDIAAAGESAAEGLTDTEQPDGHHAEVLGELGAALADPLLAEALMKETTRDGRHGAAALGMLAETLEPTVARSAQVGIRWLQAVACELLGDTAEAERGLLAAESLDPDWPPALLGLARIASDRGDAEMGLGLLRGAGVDSNHPLVHLLEQHRSQPRSDVGRNEPCWCGSGRKYKMCHLGNEQLSLADRVGWLYAKAYQQLLGGDWPGLLTWVGYERVYHVEDELDDPMAAARSDPLAIDTMLFEGGAFAEFLQSRGDLLPEDELLLAQRWLRVRRSVFDVEQVQPGRGVTVRDVCSGDIREVSERTASRALRPGQLICTRVLPTGDGFEFFGGIDPVALHDRDRLIALLDNDPEPAELVAFLSRHLGHQQAVIV